MPAQDVTRKRLRPGPLLRVLGLGVFVAVIGLIFAVSPVGRSWEEDLGLTLLFRLRGPIAPPDEVTVVAIDRESSDRLGLPENPRKWPRDLHGRLVDRLAEKGANVIVFDVAFQEQRDPAGERFFAASMRRAGNVILFEFLEKEILPVADNGDGGALELLIERRIPPAPVLADAALAVAPFALPRVPIKVSQVWLFKPEAGGAATLPLVALYAHRWNDYQEMLSLVRDLAPDAPGVPAAAPAAVTGVEHRVRGLRRLFVENPDLASRLLRRIDAKARSGEPGDGRLPALVDAFSGPDSIYLNYYGPPGTIDTLSYDQVLTGEAARIPDLSGRAVFVGAAARRQAGQRDGFYTPFTLRSGLDISGVEIAATAFANMQERNAVRPLAPLQKTLLLISWGLVLGIGLRRLGGVWILPAATVTAGAYVAAAYLAFAVGNLWLPMVAPLLAQLIPAAFGAILLRHRDLQRERENIRRAFGMHLPLPVVDQLARGIDDFTSTAEHAFGICLATDAEQYATLSEDMPPDALKDFMNAYYGAIFPPVRNRGGVISDVVGDSMLAIWATDKDRPELRKAACEAALEILEAVDAFNRAHPEHPLPIRMGLHCGELVLGHVGAVDHFEYRAVGDIVNTTSRLEGLGKHLGTRLLVSEELASGLSDTCIRPLGRFRLKGKARPLGVAELVRREGARRSGDDRIQVRFAEGLEEYRTGNLDAALACFESIQHELGGDGPAAFYLRLCRRHLAAPSNQDWTGIVVLAEK